MRSLRERNHYESGVATLVTAVVLMLAVLSATFYMSEVVVHEQRTISSDLRGKRAFHSAQAGLDHAVNLIESSVLTLPVTVNGNLAGGETYGFSIANVTSGATSASTPSVYEVVSEGLSDDLSTRRVLTQRFGRLPIVPNPPSMPVVALGNVDVTGNLSVTNNISNVTIWTGIDTSSWGSANTYIRIDDRQSQLSTTKNTRGPDVIDGDQNLAALSSDEDAFIQNFFGQSWDGLAADADITGIPPAPSDADGKVVFVDGDVHFNGGVFGATADTLIVVKGELRLSGNVEINGLVLARSVVGAGTVNVNGGLVLTENFDFGAGTFEVEFKEFGDGSGDAPFELGVITSSWKDWD